jgi:hypothetical protein
MAGGALLALVLGTGCTMLDGTGHGAAPVEVLDQRTGVTVSVLEKPLEFVQFEGVPFGKRANFAYLGPVEWNRMGDYTYGLWLHVAPGDGGKIGDIHSPASVTLLLDGAPWALVPAEPPALVGDAYRPVVAWGQTAYFELDARQLVRLASVSQLELQCRGADGSMIALRPGGGAQAQLAAYVRARHLSAD